MQLQTGQTLSLLDAQQRPLGQITLERSDGELLFGKFEPGPAFPVVEPLFRKFEEAADAQALGVVEELDRAIAALGLHLRTSAGSQRLPIHDVQYAPQAGLVAESFTGRLRYSGAALGSQLTTLLADGPALLIPFALLHRFGDPRLLAVYLGVAALVSLLSVAGLKDRSRQDMSAEYDEPSPAPAPARS